MDNNFILTDIYRPRRVFPFFLRETRRHQGSAVELVPCLFGNPFSVSYPQSLAQILWHNNAVLHRYYLPYRCPLGKQSQQKIKPEDPSVTTPKTLYHIDLHSIYGLHTNKQ